MKYTLEIIDDLYHQGSEYNDTLHDRLAEIIDYLSDIQVGEHPVWIEVVYDVIEQYTMGFLWYKFKTGLWGNEEEKTNRQLDLEKLIHKLQNTQARTHLTEFCKASQAGEGWKKLEEMRPRRRTFTLNPITLVRRGVFSIYSKLFLPLAESMNRIGFQVMALFDRYNEEECELLIKYIDSYKHLSNGVRDDWQPVLVAKLAGRPNAIPNSKKKKVVDRLLAQENLGEKAYDQMLCQVARIDQRALTKLIKRCFKGREHYLEGLEYLIEIAGVNPRAMENLIKYLAAKPDHLYTSLDKLKSLKILNKSCIQKLVELSDFPGLYDSVGAICENLSNISFDAHQYLIEQLGSSLNPSVKYIVALALSNSIIARPAGSVFNVWVEIMIKNALSEQVLQVSNSEYSTKQENLNCRALKLVLRIIPKSPLTLRKLLHAIRNLYSHKLQAALKSEYPFMNDIQARNWVDSLLDGKLDQMENAAVTKAETPPQTSKDISEISKAIRSATSSRAFWETGHSVKTRLLAQVCKEYADRIWPVLTTLSEEFVKIESEDYWTNIAGILLTNILHTTGWHPGPPLDKNVSGEMSGSLLPVLQDLSTTLNLLLKQDHQTAEQLIHFALSSEGYQNLRIRILAIRAIGCMGRITNLELGYLKQFLDSGDREIWQETEKSLFRSSWLDREGIELVIGLIVPKDQEMYSASLLDLLVETPQLVSPSGLDTLKETLTNWKSFEDDIPASWLFEYCLLSLSKNSAITEDVQEICLEFMRLRPRDIGRHTKHIRALAILTLARAGYCQEGFVEFLKDKIKYPGNKMLQFIGDQDYEELILASAVALADIGSDKSNALSLPQRKIIADKLIEATKIPWTIDTSYVGSYKKWALPKSLNDAFYQSSTRMLQALQGIEHQTAKQIRNLA